MRNLPIHTRCLLLLLAATAPLTGCGDFGDDGERFEKLDRLRVLAIQADPPDLTFGETATLRANIYEPAARDVSFDWAWCPSRGDEGAAFACNISEDELAQAWAAAGLSDPAPTYDLGTTPEVELTHQLDPVLVAALCGAPGLDERLAIACFLGLEASIKLTVRTSEAELTAIKSVPLLLGEAPDPERNTNPPSDFALTLRDKANDSEIEGDEPLEAGHTYVVTADVDDAVAESFTPSVFPGEPPPAPRREMLVMSWFVTVGQLVPPSDEETFGGDDSAHTTFVDGSNSVEDLSKNGWELPLTAGPSAALHLVLRDERGGVGWATRSFSVIGGEQ